MLLLALHVEALLLQSLIAGHLLPLLSFLLGLLLASQHVLLLLLLLLLSLGALLSFLFGLLLSPLHLLLLLLQLHLLGLGLGLGLGALLALDVLTFDLVARCHRPLWSYRSHAGYL